MKNILRTEETGLFLLSVYLFYLLPYDWWWFFILLLAPDISMLGYIVNTKFGAMVYNIGHHRGLASVMYISGAAVGIHWLMLAGIIIFAHACMDRIFGFGMKYNDSFKHTYLDDLERKIS